MADMNATATANSPFFTVLPPELRVSILTAALGGMTLHIQQCQPESLQSQMEAPAVVPQVSRGALGTAKQRLGRLFRAKTKEKRKATRPARRPIKWCGRVCRRQPDVSPAQDSCVGNLAERLRAGGCSCGSPPELAVGVIGWLLTCRRAYDEGITILYSSSTFHVRTTSMGLLGRLVPQIPATILSRITSVECVMEELFRGYKDYHALEPAERCEGHMLERTLSNIPRLMPSLQKLYIGFWPDTCLLLRCEYGSTLAYECTTYFASLMEAMALQFAQMGRTCDLELGLPLTPFERYHFEASNHGRNTGLPNWKPEFSSMCSYHPRLRLFQPAQSRKLGPELGIDGGGGSDVGYWISMSQQDNLQCRF